MHGQRSRCRRGCHAPGNSAAARENSAASGEGRLGLTTFERAGVLGVALLIWIGVQPPNDKALTVTAATIGLLVVAWWLGVRKSFRGPPVMSTLAASTKSDVQAEPQYAGK